MRPQHLLLPLLLATVACGDQPTSAAPDAGAPRFVIADASREYKAGFFWLPPMVGQPASMGAFDAGLAPTVEICVLGGGDCVSELAEYTTTTGPGGETVRLHADEQLYQVNWHTNEFDVQPGTFYRIAVYAGIDRTLLGYADVEPVNTGNGLKRVDSEEYIGLVDGRTLPIKFRIETGVVGRLTVSPARASAEPGEERQFTAAVADLYGNPMSAEVTWSSSNDEVAAVDQNGLATASAAGDASIVATAEQVSGSATLTVVDFGACSPFRPLAWYPLDDHGNDASGNGRHGTVQGAFGFPNRLGVALSAMSFDGIDDAIQLGDEFNTLMLPFSVAAWVRQPASGRGDYRGIFTSDDHVGRYYGITFELDPAGLAIISYGNSGLPGPASRRTLTSNEPIPTGTWVHIAATVRGPTDMTLYVNGVAIAGTYSGTGGPLVHSSAPARIAQRTVNPESHAWRGELDDLRIYDCSLEPNAVTALLDQP